MKKLRLLFVSAQIFMLPYIPSIFAADDFISVDSERYENVKINPHERLACLERKINKFDILILDDTGLTHEENKKLVELIENRKGHSNILYSSKLNKSYFKKMLKHGVNGIVSHRSSVIELQEAVIKISQGKEYFCDKVKECLLKLNKFELILTVRELEILEFLNNGSGYKEIAGRLIISPKTVNRHIEDIKKRLGAKNLMELRKIIQSENNKFGGGGDKKQIRKLVYTK
jgi:DNA-binding NarL/FixJ family response regulator